MSPQTTPPIVRITQEQLEYLIGSLGDDRAARKRLKNSKPAYFTFVSPGAGTFQVLNADETRIALFVSCTGANVSFNTNPNVVVGDAIICYQTTPLGMPIVWHEYGYIITRPWFGAFSGATFGLSFISISCPGFWDV